MATSGTIRIGIALSGGGERAVVFHLGVLARLADEGLLEEITFLSTVSGGSMTIGLVHALLGNRWPGSAAFLTTVVPEARRRLTRASIASSATTSRAARGAPGSWPRGGPRWCRRACSGSGA